MSVRVRFAPSPTGELHIGGARTAIYNWAFARRMGGVFVLRIDDTDAERSSEENTGQILRSLRWLGVDWDEGPEVGGSFGPYYQAERTAHYAEALDALTRSGHAYPCFCAADDLAARREAVRASGGPGGYDRTCRRLPADERTRRLNAGDPHVWRVSVPEDRGDIVVEDAVRGEVVFPADAMDDLILVRTDGSPTYNFASVVDDWRMGITHVIRGDDHLSNTPRQIVIFEALGAPVPTFAHLSMIWGPDGKKLSKRHGATSVEQFHAEGFLPEALLNYLALLGWSLDGETTIISAETLTAHFSLDRISKNPAIFDIEKLEWMNGAYIREMAPDAFAARMVERLAESGLTGVDDLAARPEWYRELAPLVAERTKRMTDVVPMAAFLFSERIAIDEATAAKALRPEGVVEALRAARESLSALDRWVPETIEDALREVPERLGVKPKIVFQAVRVAVSGSLVSLPLFESLVLLGKEASLARLEHATRLAEA